MRAVGASVLPRSLFYTMPKHEAKERTHSLSRTREVEGVVEVEFGTENARAYQVSMSRGAIPNKIAGLTWMSLI